MVLGALGDARAKARDARRKLDIKTIQTQLELYHLENNQYPSSVLGALYPNGAWANSSDASWEALGAELGVSLPKDPTNESGGYAHSRYLNYSYYGGYGTIAGCLGKNTYIIVYRYESRDATNEENIGIVNCDTGDILRYGGGSITVGSSPAE